MTRRLEGRVALITGGSRGIGRAIALRFAKEGARICANYHRSEDKARELVEEIRSFGGEAIMLRADVSRLDEVRRLISCVIEEFGRLDILVNNAAIMIRGGFIAVSYTHLTLPTNREV